MTLHFKFSTESAPEARERLVEALLADGATAAFPMFDGEDDPEVAALYVVEVKDHESEERILAVLEKAEEVEFAEQPVWRRLIW